MFSRLLNKIGVFIVVIVVAVSLSACAEEPDEVTLYLKWLHQAQFAGFYMAEEAGFYEENDLRVAIRPIDMELAPIDAVLNDEAQFGIVGTEELLRAQAAGKPVVAVATSFQLSPVGFVTMADSGIQSPQDFAGQQVGVLPAGGTELPYRMVMANAGLSADDVEEIPIGFEATPFYEGEIDVYPVFILNEPYLIRQEGYEINVILASDYGAQTYTDLLFTTEELINEDPDLVRRFVSASLQGWRYAIENQEETVDVVLSHAPDANRGHQKEMMRVSWLLANPGAGTTLGYMEEKVWQRVHDTMLAYDMLPHELDLEKAYTNEFID